VKINESISELVLELVELETPDNTRAVLTNKGVSLKGLIDVYSETVNSRSRQVVLEIIDEVGNDWAPELSEEAQAANEAASFDRNRSQGWANLSEDEFMDLLPANSYMH